MLLVRQMFDWCCLLIYRRQGSERQKSEKQGGFALVLFKRLLRPFKKEAFGTSLVGKG